jgi:hypothetical protein
LINIHSSRHAIHPVPARTVSPKFGQITNALIVKGGTAKERQTKIDTFKSTLPANVDLSETRIKSKASSVGKTIVLYHDQESETGIEAIKAHAKKSASLEELNKKEFKLVYREIKNLINNKTIQNSRKEHIGNIVKNGAIQGGAILAEIALQGLRGIFGLGAIILAQ